MQKITARAHTNIALIKYWGKKDKQLFLPFNNSLSLTLEEFYTDTTVSPSLADEFYLNGIKQNHEELAKIQNYLQIFRDLTNNSTPLKIESTNHVPTAAGLASSSSAYAALALALTKFYDLDFDYQTISSYARRGSGSATRSLFGGFVEWEQGFDHQSSHAIQVNDAKFDIGLLICLINKNKKRIPSRQGMEHTVQTSTFYKQWIKSAASDLQKMKQAIKKQDVVKIGQIAEHNAMQMHATTLAANPPFTYFEPDTLKLIQTVQELRKQGFNCYYTIDAGPNVKIIAPYSELAAIKTELLKCYPTLETIITKPGPNAFYL